MQTYLELANAGVYLGFDQTGKEKYWPDARHVELVKTLIEAGYLRQVLLSGNARRKSAWHTHNPRVEGIAHLLVCFAPALTRAEVSEKDIQTLLVENPARFLAF